jgi:hypothetical protein
MLPSTAAAAAGHETAAEAVADQVDTLFFGD